MAKDTWVKLYTSILLSNKYRNLPSNNHRLVFIHSIMFQKRGIIHGDNTLLSSLCSLSTRKFNLVINDLKASSLLNDDGSVKNFESMQLSADAERKQRQRMRDKSRDKSQEKSRESHRDADAEAYKNKTPLIPPRGIASEPKPEKQIVLDCADAAVTAFNENFGTRRKANGSVVKAVKAALNVCPEATPDDFRAIVTTRSKERWVDPRKTLIPSLIRAKDFESHVELVREKGAVEKDGIIQF